MLLDERTWPCACELPAGLPQTCAPRVPPLPARSWEAAALGWGVLGLTCALLAAVIALSIAKFSHEAEPVLFEGDGAW